MHDDRVCGLVRRLRAGDRPTLQTLARKVRRVLESYLSLRQALTADASWNGSGFDGVPEQGLRTYALIYASWATSQPFFQTLDQPVEEHVEQHWLPNYRRHDPRDLIAMLDTWLANDVADGGDLSQALAGIEASAAVVAWASPSTSSASS